MEWCLVWWRFGRRLARCRAGALLSIEKRVLLRDDRRWRLKLCVFDTVGTAMWWRIRHNLTFPFGTFDENFRLRRLSDSTPVTTWGHSCIISLLAMWGCNNVCVCNKSAMEKILNEWSSFFVQIVTRRALNVVSGSLSFGALRLTTGFGQHFRGFVLLVNTMVPGEAYGRHCLTEWFGEEPNCRGNSDLAASVRHIYLHRKGLT